MFQPHTQVQSPELGICVNGMRLCTHPHSHNQPHAAHLEHQAVLELTSGVQLLLVLPAQGPLPDPPGAWCAKAMVPNLGLAPLSNQRSRDNLTIQLVAHMWLINTPAP